MNPATEPMSNAAHGLTRPAHPLMATKPHKMPLFTAGSSFFGQTYASVSIVAPPPAAAVSVVATAAFAAMAAPPFSSVPTATQLNPYHPNHRNMVPAVWNTGLAWAWASARPRISAPADRRQCTR